MHLRKTGSTRLDHQAGIALPLAIALGMAMVAIASASLLLAQGDRNVAVQRQSSESSFLVTDSALARVLIQLSKLNNSILLVRNYDSINPTTGKTYLGEDSIPQNGDETGTGVDQWTGYDPSGAPCFQQMGQGSPNMPLTGTIGSNASYTIRAYRYNKAKKTGILLVEGKYKGQSSLVSVSLSIEPLLDDFPAILLFDRISDPSYTGTLALRGRQILGNKGNVYYRPLGSANSSLTGFSRPNDPSRPDYFNALWSSSSNDGASSNTVEGTIYSCGVTPNIPSGISGANLGVINASTTLKGVGGKVPTYFKVDKINLSNSDTLTVDTTGGPVYIEFTYQPNGVGIPNFTLRHSAKVLNIRTDGQTPKVGDLRFMLYGGNQTVLYDQTCIQNAFLYSHEDELRIFTSGPGCPGGKNTNFEGVAWVEAVLSSKNATGNRNVNYLKGSTGSEYDTTITAGATSGIAVPDDLSSLSDLIEYIDWPVRYRYGSIQGWQRVN